VKGWLLRQPARSRQIEDITPACMWKPESLPWCDVSYRERSEERDRHLRFSANIKKAVSGCGRGARSCLEKAGPVVDEQTKNCSGDYESENHGPPVILGEVCRQELCFR
jgi:hypothetical protein